MNADQGTRQPARAERRPSNGELLATNRGHAERAEGLQARLLATAYRATPRALGRCTPWRTLSVAKGSPALWSSPRGFDPARLKRSASRRPWMTRLKPWMSCSPTTVAGFRFTAAVEAPYGPAGGPTVSLRPSVRGRPAIDPTSSVALRSADAERPSSTRRRRTQRHRLPQGRRRPVRQRAAAPVSLVHRVRR